jgi:hypothetical protein
MSDNVKYYLDDAKLGEEWDKFISSSPNGTAFALSDYVEAINCNTKLYYCYKNKELMAAVLCIVSQDNSEIIGHDYVIYDGLIYRDLSHLNRSQRYSEEYKIQQCVAESLSKKYSKISLNLHPSIVDIRAFLWVNYFKDSPKYIPEIRYTSYVEISDFKHLKQLEKISIYKNSSVARRQEIRYSRKKNVQTNQVKDLSLFISFYKKTMERQGIDDSSHISNNMEGLLYNLLKDDKCIMIQSTDSKGEVGSMAVFIMDKYRAYYLFGANEPKMRNEHTGTAVLWESFYLLAQMGFKEVDLEGINSPNRGWFKLSFGGYCIPYYSIKIG